MLKRLLLLFFFSGSLDSFSQDKIDTVQIFDKVIGIFRNDTLMGYVRQPDTLRAIVLVTTAPNGIAHARMGYVVICEGKEVQYLDCRKRALKLPMVGWGYRVVNPNERLR